MPPERAGFEDSISQNPVCGFRVAEISKYDRIRSFFERERVGNKKEKSLAHK
jgi:hypothetical protein